MMAAGKIIFIQLKSLNKFKKANKQCQSITVYYPINSMRRTLEWASIP
jgi:hypothetical protein